MDFSQQNSCIAFLKARESGTVEEGWTRQGDVRVNMIKVHYIHV
jgi:hypothetical protein